MLDISELDSGYSGSEVLNDVSLEVNAGEIVSIIGPNGAGKSTVLKSIFNLCDVYSGYISLRDRTIKGLPTHDLIDEGISFVPQGRQIFTEMTIRENLEMGGFIFNDQELVQRNMEDVFDKFPFLKDRQDSYGFELSGGQQQMLALGRALVQNPDLLLLDEPSLGLSPQNMDKIFEKIQEINDEGISVLIVEQNAKKAVSESDRAYVLEGGEVVLEGGKNILEKGEIQHLFFGGR